LACDAHDIHGAAFKITALRPSRSKQDQAQPNKTKQKSLDLLGFIRPNRDFSMGYGESK
jgi:hypothetical protein